MQTTDSLLLPIALGIIMFGIGLNLRFSNFKTLLAHPKQVLFGLLGQMVLLPSVAFVIALLYPMDPVHKVGLVLIAACPGGTASNLVTFLLKGRVALSVALTAFNSLLIVVTIPLIISAASGLFFDSSSWIALDKYSVFQEVALTVILPVLAGMLLNSRFSSWVDYLRTPMRYILPAILLAVFSVVLFSNGGNGVDELLEQWDLLIPVVALNVGTMLLGFYSSLRLGLEHQSSYTIAIEMGLQNSALAIFLAYSVLRNEEVALVAVLYGSVSFFITVTLGWLFARGRNAKTTSL